jgi:hypothetical protein
MKNYYLYIILISLVILSGCTISNIKYLSKAKESPDETYGLTKSKPVSINIKRLGDSHKIVQEYISRLYSNKMEGFEILKKTTLQKNDKPISNKNDIDNIIEEYLLITKDKKDSLKLYFDFNKKSKELKYPHGFLFGQLSGK